MLNTREEIKEKEWMLEAIKIANNKNRLVEGAYIIDIEDALKNSIRELKGEKFE